MLDRVVPYLPKEGVIKDYIDFTTGGEECPRFRFFSFLGTLGSVVGRKIYFQRSSKDVFPTLFPPMWIILVAPQGQGKKSSSLRVARNFLNYLPQNLKPKVLASKLTPEALVKALCSPVIKPEILASAPKETVKIIKKPAQGLLHSSEFGVLLGREKYNQGMIALLTDLYDCPEEWTSETIMHGDQRLYDVCIFIMGASTPDWLQSMLPTDAFKGGFMSRLVLVALPNSWFVREADPPIPPEDLKERIISQLTEIAKKSFQMSWTKEAREFFTFWYESLPLPEPGPKAQYLERKQDHLLRLAMLLEISYQKHTAIQQKTLEQALNILNSIEFETLQIIDYISIEPKMRPVQRVYEYIEAKGIVSEAELLNETWRYFTRAQDFDDIIRMLIRSKRVKFLSKRNEETGETETYYTRRKENE